MAEYAGLEIRIGGDTTKLTNALKASTKSAAELQSRIRQATRAMQFDPTDLKNVETRIKVTGDRMQSLQSKAQIAKTAMKQLGETMTNVLDKGGNPMSVKRIAEETENLSLKAKQADERFNGLTSTLAKIYESWNKVSRNEGSDFLVEHLKFTQADADRLMSSATSVREMVFQLRQLQEIRKDPFADGPLISDADIEKAKAFKELDFHNMFKRGLGLDEVIDEAKELGIVIEDSAIANVRELQKTFKGAQQEKKAFDSALQYQQLGSDIQRINSEAESLSQTMRGLDDTMTETTSFRPFQNLEDRIRTIDAALANVDNDLKRTGEAMKVDPGNVGLASRYFDDLQQKAELSEEKVSLLNQQLKMLDGNGASQAAQDHQDLAMWIEKSAESARVAQKNLSDQRAAVANLEDQQKSLQQAIATMKGDSTLVAYSDDVLQWQKQSQKLATQMEELAKAESNAVEQQERLGVVQANFDEAASIVEQYKAKITELKAEYEQLEATSTEAFDRGEEVDYSRMAALSNEIRDLGEAYATAGESYEKLDAALKDQQERVKIAGSSLEQQKDRVNELKTAVSELAETRDVRIFQNPTDEIEKAEQSLVELNGQLSGAIAKENELEDAYKAAKADNELAKTANAAQEVSQRANEAKASLEEVTNELNIKSGSILNASTVKSIGMTLSATLTPTFTALGYKMVDASATVDAAYRDMRKTVNGTEEQFEHFKQAAIDFSRTHVTSADQILEIEAIGGELGIATENLETFAEVISNIDVATNLDTESAAETLGHLSNILHLTEEDYVGFSDALVRLGNNGASTETEIANIAERIGSMGSIVGMSGSDILAWASTIASTGQNAEAAGTAISKTMSFFETAVASAGGTIDASFDSINAAVEEGGDRLTVFANLMGMSAEEFTEAWDVDAEATFDGISNLIEESKGSLQGIADVAHMTADEFVHAWESDPTAVMEAFIKGLNDIEEAGGSADAVLQGFDITSVRQKQAIEGLMQTIGGLDDNLRMSENAWNGVSDKWGQAGDAANEASKKAEGFSGQIQILKNMWQAFLSELGEGAAPWIQSLSNTVRGISEWFSTLNADTKKWIVAMGGIATALGPMLSIGATFATAKNEFFNWVDSTVSGMSIVKAAYRSGGQEAVDSLMDTMTTMDKTKYVAGQLGKSLLMSVASAGIVAGVALIGSELYKLYDHYKDHIAATKGLSDALSRVGTDTKTIGESFEESGRSLSELSADSREYEGRLADLAKTIEDSNRQYGAYAGQMDYYAETIRELGGNSSLSTDEAFKLSAALQAVNDACGTTYGLDEYGNIIDTETGKIQNSTEAILANIDARKQQALVDYYSDDYSQAVAEWAEAQDKLNEAQEKYNELTSEEGRNAYFEGQKAVLGKDYSTTVAQLNYDAEVEKAAETVRNYTGEVNLAGQAVEKLEGKIASAEEGQRKANEVLQEAAKAQEEYERRTDTVSGDVTGNMKRMSDAVAGLGKSDADFNAMADGLNAVHAYADELNGVDMTSLASAFDSADGSIEQVIATLEAGGVQMWTWNAALEQVPGAAEKMGTVTASAFQSMYEIAGGSLEGTMTLIEGLDEVQVDDKTFYIGDNGSIVDSEGKIYDINSDIASIPDEVITQYYVDDAGAAQKAIETKDALTAISEEAPTATIDVQDNATESAENLQDELDAIDSTTASPTANLNDRASSGLNYISNLLYNLNGRSATVTVTTVEKTTKQATGGLNSRPVIPRHASGYIATGPTMTNQGWIGEDGIEAVANWASGGVVVPLTNKKYMLPIADAIAEGMARRTGSGVTNTYVIDGLTVAPDSALAKAMDSTFDEARRYARMGRR